MKMWTKKKKKEIQQSVKCEKILKNIQVFWGAYKMEQNIKKKEVENYLHLI